MNSNFFISAEEYRDLIVSNTLLKVILAMAKGASSAYDLANFVGVIRQQIEPSETPCDPAEETDEGTEN